MKCYGVILCGCPCVCILQDMSNTKEEEEEEENKVLEEEDDFVGTKCRVKYTQV